MRAGPAPWAARLLAALLAAPLWAARPAAAIAIQSRGAATELPAQGQQLSGAAPEAAPAPAAVAAPSSSSASRASAAEGPSASRHNGTAAAGVNGTSAPVYLSRLAEAQAAGAALAATAPCDHFFGLPKLTWTILCDILSIVVIVLCVPLLLTCSRRRPPGAPLFDCGDGLVAKACCGPGGDGRKVLEPMY